VTEAELRKVAEQFSWRIWTINRIGKGQYCIDFEEDHIYLQYKFYSGRSFKLSEIKQDSKRPWIIGPFHEIGYFSLKSCRFVKNIQ